MASSGQGARSAGSGSVAAVDLGATSGRVMVGHVDRERVQLEQIARFPNEPIELWEDHRSALHWNLPSLFAEALDGLRVAVERADREAELLASIGVDSWAVDYALLQGGRMVGLPYHYRDARHTQGVATVQRAMDPAELYQRTGLQHLPFNTVFQMAADPLVHAADRALLIPDLVGYWLTGQAAAETTNASTTGLRNARTGMWDPAIRAAAHVPTGLLPVLRSPGDALGELLPSVHAQLGAPASLGVTLVGSHDTASAVVAVPATDPDFAYISSGTWSLVGVELERPILTAAASASNCTNEGGVDGRVRFLKNVSGLWLLSQSIRTWERAGHTIDLEALLTAAADVTDPVPLFDTMDERFTPPGDIPERIDAWCREHDIAPPTSPAEHVRSILESLAAAYADTVEALERVTGRAIRVVHVVGGGAQNALLCQLTADRTERPVLAGPVEATALGNVLVQARAAGLGGLAGASLDALRSRVARSVRLVRYLPRASRLAQRTPATRPDSVRNSV